MTTDSPMRHISERAVSGTLGVSMSATSWENCWGKLILLQCLRLHSARGACEGARCLRAADYLRIIGLSAPRPGEGPTDWQCTTLALLRVCLLFSSECLSYLARVSSWRLCSWVPATT